MRIIWEEVPSAVKKEVEPHVKRFTPVLPAWIELMRIVFSPPGDAAFLATIEISYEYRQIQVCIHPRFLTIDYHRQATTILHEFIHTTFSGPSGVFSSLVDAAVDEDNPLGNWADEEWRKAEEAAVTDLEYGIARLLGMKAPTS